MLYCFIVLFREKNHKKLQILLLPTFTIYLPIFFISRDFPDFSGQLDFGDEFLRSFRKFLRSFADGKFCNILRTVFRGIGVSARKLIHLKH